MISHFLLNLQDISTVTSNGSDPSRPSFVRSDQGQVSSIRFADSIIRSFGMALRDGSLNDDEEADDAVAEDIELTDLQATDEERNIGSSSFVMDIMEENVAGPSRIPAGPRARHVTVRSNGENSVKALA